MSKRDKLAELFSTERGRRMEIAEIMRWTGASSRSYVYDLAQQLGYKRVDGTFINVDAQTEHDSLLYQMVSELHDRFLINDDKYDDKGRLRVALPEPWVVEDGYMVIPVDEVPADKYPEWAAAAAKIPGSEKPDGIKQVIAVLAGAAYARLNELNKKG